MRRVPLIRSIVATLFGLFAAVVGATVAPLPAAADGQCCQVALTGFPKQFHAGAGAENFQVYVKNTSNNPISTINVTLSFKASNLNRNQLQLSYQHNGSWRGIRTSEQNGMIVASSSPNSDFFKHNNIDPGQSKNFPYRLSFGGKVPSQALSVYLTVTPGFRGGQAAQAGPYQSEIVAVGAATTPKPTPTPTPTPTMSDSAAATPDASSSDDLGAGVAPTELGGSSDGGSGSSMTWLAYTIGALLLLGGIGVIGTLLWRRGPRPVETDWVEPDPYAQPNYPAAPYSGGGYDPYNAPAQGTPTMYGGPAAPTAQYGGATPTAPYSTPQDPYGDETRLDLR